MGAIPQFQDAQDVLQKVAVVAFRKQDQFQGTDFAAWVKAIARYEILHYRRDHARDRLVFDDRTLEKLGTAQETLGSELDERFAALLGCLESLAGRPRQVTELRYRGGLTPSNIAKQLNTTAGTINVTLSSDASASPTVGSLF